MYGLSDPQILAALEKKAALGVDSTVIYDQRGSPGLGEKLSSAIQSYPIKGTGLMHKKLLVVDDHLVFLGSANMTTQSLAMHDNLVLGLFAPQLARFIKNEVAGCCSFTVANQRAEFWLLPDCEERALERLLGLINSAKKTIRVAMFTLTHPRLVGALVQAQKRHVRVSVACDFYTGRGASYKALEILREAKIPVYLSQGQQLLHHKWAWIDEQTLIVGSANWTRAAFAKNEDCFLILQDLTKPQIGLLSQMWKIIKLDSTS
jgi:phosphatidylserine/phosphatidylglycerophosphate/cardiolipin synthase-like enzyme